MPYITRDEPLSWYIDKLKRREPFSSLLYGDGEFLVMTGTRSGQIFTQHHEFISQAMEDELWESLCVINEHPEILRGTDLNLLNYMDYKGNDKDYFRNLGREIETVTSQFQDITWYNGVVWEDAVSAGKLGPLLRILKEQDTCLIGNQKLERWNPFSHQIITPDRNAHSKADNLADAVRTSSPFENYIVCMGLGAIPLIMRLRNIYPKSTFLDLGSVLDVFVKASPERGWRSELYSNPRQWQRIVDMNMEGVR